MALKTNMHHTYNTCMRAYINTHNYAVIVIKDVNPGCGCTQRCVCNTQTSSPNLPPHTFLLKSKLHSDPALHSYISSTRTHTFANTDANTHTERVTEEEKKKNSKKDEVSVVFTVDHTAKGAGERLLRTRSCSMKTDCTCASRATWGRLSQSVCVCRPSWSTSTLLRLKTLSLPPSTAECCSDCWVITLTL